MAAPASATRTAVEAEQTSPMLNVETWEAATDSAVAVNRYDKRGGEKAVMCGGQSARRVQVTTAEREELNEERAANAALCPFRNGYLRPIRNVPQDVLDRFVTETLPIGGQSVEELVEMLTKSGPEFVQCIGRLNEPALRRIAALAPEADATSSQMGAIEAAMEKFKVTIRETEADKINRAAPAQAN